MPLKYYFLGIFVCFNVIVRAQNYTGSVKGRVVDKDTRQPIDGVNVLVVNSTPPLGTVTDGGGEFRLSGLNTGRISLKFSYIGYEEAAINEVLISTGKELVLNIEIKEKVSEMNEAVVKIERDKSKGYNPFSVVSTRSISMDEMSRYAGTLNDPARMVQAVAGVVSSNDENNAIVIRGNSPRGLLWRLEGVEIPNPNHFAGDDGASGGGVTILSANMLANTDFYSGAFPAEFGNASSGVFDLNFRKGNADRWEFTIQTGVLGLEAALEGPFVPGKQHTYLINYRYSTLDILNLIGIKIGGDVLPKYQDLAYNFNFPTKKAGTFTFYGMGGISSLGTTVKGNPDEWKSIKDKSTDGQKYQIGTTGITHLFLFRDQQTWIKTNLNFSITDNTYFSDTLNDDYEKGRIFDNNYLYKTWRISSTVNRKVNSRLVIKTGAILSAIEYRLKSRAFNFYTNNLNTRVDERGLAWQAQAFAQWQYRFNPSWTLNAGLHALFFELNRDFSLEPRIGVEYKVNNNHTLTFGAGLHSKADAISAYVAKLPEPQAYGREDNRNVKMMKSAQFVLGHNFSFLKSFRVKTEIYAQYLFQVPVGKDSTAAISLLNLNDDFSNIALYNKGTGINYGMELTAEKFFSKQYYFLVSFSLFDSKYKSSDGKWRNTAYNANYVLNVLGGKEFSLGKRKNNIIGVNAKIVYRGGFRYTPVDIESSRLYNTTVYDIHRTNELKLPDYFRMDFGIYFRRNKKKWSWQLSFDAQNVINRKNLGRYSYDPETREISEVRNLGIVPVISFKAEFGFKVNVKR